MTASARLGLLSTLPAGRDGRRLALAAMGVSAALFLAAAPFAKVALPPIWGFIPIYESALVVNDLITAALLFGQYRISRSRALWVLACGYLFTACIAAVHLLTFPGVFSPTGLLGAGAQSTAWLYMFWHAGFPLFVVAYALLKERDGAESAPPEPRGPTAAIWGGLAAVALAVCGLALIATAGQGLLPAIMQGNRYTPTMIVVVGTVWGLSLLALITVWRRRPHSVIDLWLMVVMSAWLFDVALSAMLNGGRFDLGFYAGRIYGLLSSAFVLMVLLRENGSLYASLVGAHESVRQEATEAKQLGVQLANLNRMLEDKNTELAQATRLKSEFLSNMSHELRTPLNAIIGFSDMMKDGLAGDLSPQHRGYIGHIFQSGQHLLSLINDILDLSKIEAGKVEIEFEPVDVQALLSDSVLLLADRAKSKQIRLVRETRGGASATLLADQRRLKQIVYNLLANAMKFTPANGQVTLRDSLVDRARAANALPGFGSGVRMTLPDNEFSAFLEISVSDTGIGIEATDVTRLFTPFAQASNPLTRNIEGTGLGLAMVRRLADVHGGTVAVTSQPGRGSCFTVWVPWREAPSASHASPVEPPRAEPQTGPLALVVEDDDEAAMLMRLQLETEGFRVRCVASAEAALQLAGQLTPDVITVDILLPGMDGWEFIGRLKDVPAWGHVPVVVVSVVADHGRGFSLGASLVLQKPLSRETLVNGLGRLGLIPSGERKITVLVIDDDASAVEILATNLHQSGYVVLRALGGREGIALARRFRPDLIALDLEMPEVNGFDVVEALTSTPETAAIPIIVVTARQLSPKLRDQLNGHIHDIVNKADFHNGRFIGEVRRALNKTADGVVPSGGRIH